MAANNSANDPEKSREQILQDLLDAEAKLDAVWQGRLLLEEKRTDEAEAQLDLDIASLIENSEDPPLTKKLWHNAQSSILSNIEKGPLRNFALAEKGLFLRKRGNTTDQKFSFKQANQVVWDVVSNWINSNANPIELGMSLWDLNEELGYHRRKAPRSQMPLAFDS
jgi:hypothetical protein